MGTSPREGQSQARALPSCPSMRLSRGHPGEPACQPSPLPPVLTPPFLFEHFELLEIFRCSLIYFICHSFSTKCQSLFPDKLTLPTYPRSYLATCFLQYAIANVLNLVFLWPSLPHLSQQALHWRAIAHFFIYNNPQTVPKDRNYICLDHCGITSPQPSAWHAMYICETY